MENESPTPTRVKVKVTDTMNFPDAIRKVIEGKKITRLEWKESQGEDYYALLTGGFLMLHKPDNKHYQWIINDGDLEADDYILI